MLAEANALGSDGELVAGSSLTAPEVKTSRNDAGTFKPYNPGEIAGSSAPGLPYIQPPSQGGCGTLGMIIMVIVIIVVTIYTAGAASAAAGSAMTGATTTAGSTAFATASATAGAAGTLTTTGAVTAGAIGGAVGGAAGIAAGTAIGSAMGVASFSWRGVAAGAVTGAITGGFGAYATATNLSGAARVAGAAIASTGGAYTGQKVAGLDASFSWRNVAMSAVSSALTSRITPAINEKFNITSDFGTGLSHGFTGGAISSGLRAMNGETLHGSDYWNVAADAFGNALGNLLVDKSATQKRESETAKERVSASMREASNYLREQMEARTNMLVQADLDQMRDATVESGLAQANARFQTSLNADYARWETAERARMAAEMAARARAMAAQPHFTIPSPDYMGFIAGLSDASQRNQPSYMKRVEELYGISRVPAMSLANDPRLDPATRKPMPQMQATDDTWTLARARGERELKAWRNMQALDERIGDMLSFFGPKYDNGTVAGQGINPITGKRVSGSRREQAIGDIIGIATLFVGPSAAGRVGATESLTPYGTTIAGEMAAIGRIGITPKNWRNYGPGERSLTQVEYRNLMSQFRSNGAVLQNELDTAIAGQNFVYRATTKSAVEGYRSAGFISGYRGGGAYMSTDYVGLDPKVLMDRGQIFSHWGEREVLLRIPTSELTSAVVPRPLGNRSSIGWEPRTLFYPAAGTGNTNQFLGVTRSWDDSWVVPLNKRTGP